MIETWEGVCRAYFGLSEEGKEKVKSAAIAYILHLPEKCSFPKPFNCPCPNPNCDALLQILETDTEDKLCTCRNYNLWITWKDKGPIVGLISPVVHEEEL